MRMRNNKVNVFLSDDEKFILKSESSKLNLSQSEYIRNLIVGYNIKIPEVKEEPKSTKEEYVIENIECLIKVKSKINYLGYFEDERVIGTKIEYLKLQNTTLKNILVEIIRTMLIKHCPYYVLIFQNIFCIKCCNITHNINSYDSILIFNYITSLFF